MHLLRHHFDDFIVDSVGAGAFIVLQCMQALIKHVAVPDGVVEPWALFEGAGLGLECESVSGFWVLPRVGTLYLFRCVLSSLDA